MVRFDGDDCDRGVSVVAFEPFDDTRAVCHRHSSGMKFYFTVDDLAKGGEVENEEDGAKD